MQSRGRGNGMQGIYDGVLRFKGTWRDYQARVLSRAEKYLADGKVHIVAAPGSGKTTLGIEMIRRLGAPCLILSPSITIRQQWLERIVEGFLTEGNAPEDWLSHDPRRMKAITAITYQALYSAMGGREDPEDEEDLEPEELSEEETEDLRDFHILEAVEAAGIRTICLDEAHHLRSAWWKALEAFVKELHGVTVISLTATPPYDSTPAQWKRYIDLCGPIDEEIFTPELVREGSLCPHEDYIYFNWPAKEELEELEDHEREVARLRARLLEDGVLAGMIATHQGLLQPEAYADRFLEDPPYFSSLLIFCQAQGIPFSPYLQELIGTRGRLPALTDSWLEILLQGFLYEDAASYTAAPEQRQALLRLLKEAGCIRRRRVVLTQTEAHRKLLMKSQGKLESIARIVEAEQRSLGAELRLLVLCDYIKKEQLPLVGTDRPLRAGIGAVSIFEFLRRAGLPGVRLGCLSGSVVLLPMDTAGALAGLLRDKGSEGTLVPLGDTGYGRLQVQGKTTHVVAAVTELFRRGAVHALVGTKALLGEGWDAPCVNALVLATYVGSFMLSNQMRGRTIRTDRENPEKTGNVWHLACVFPRKEGRTRGVDLSGDYETLTRRFDAFLGVSWTGNTIESGIGRLGIPAFDSQKKMEEINQAMLARAADREALRQRWQNALQEIHGEMEIQHTEDVSREEAPLGYVFLHALGMEILWWTATVLLYLGRAFAQSNGGLISVALGMAMAAAAGLAVKYGIKLFRFGTPARRMKRISQAVVDALREIGALEDPDHCRAEVESAGGVVITTWLKGGTTRDKTAFAACMEEIWGILDNPRYLLIRMKKHRRTQEAYSVPEVFGRQKQRAAVFEKHMRRVLGGYRLVYTRTPEGRKLLLWARTRSFVNRNQRALLGKKVAKGRYA